MSIKLVGNRARSRDILRAISARRADNNDVTDLRAGFDQMRCPRASGRTRRRKRASVAFGLIYDPAKERRGTGENRGSGAQGVVAHGRRVRLIGDSFLIYLTRERSIERTGGRNPFRSPSHGGGGGAAAEGARGRGAGVGWWLGVMRLSGKTGSGWGGGRAGRGRREGLDFFRCTFLGFIATIT